MHHRHAGARAGLQTAPAFARTMNRVWGLGACVRGSRLFAVVALLGGCDVVFRLDDLTASTRADAAEQMPDAYMPGACETIVHDEDGDGYDDECDRCPGIVDDQSDTDGDGVGNACDPSSTTTDKLAVFESFAKATHDWRVLTGSWPHDGESMSYGSVSLIAYGITLYEGQLPDPPFVVEYSYTIEVIEERVSGFQVLLDSDMTGKGVTCGNVRHDTPIRDVVRSTYQAVGNELPIATASPGGYRVVARYDRAMVQCSLRGDSGAPMGATTLMLPSPPAAGQLGMRSMQVGAKLHYIAVYARL